MARVLSMEISTSLIRLCEVDYKVKSPKVYKWATVKLPEGAVMDDTVVVTEELVALIKETLRENHIRVKKMVFTMSSTKIANREVTIPYIKENKVEEYVRTNASDFFPVDLELYELGHSIIGVTENDKGIKQYKVHVFATPKTIIAGYMNLAAALGGSVEALDYSGNSIFQMIKTHGDEDVQMVVKIDENSSIITILRNQTIALQRTISYGIDEATAELINTSGYVESEHLQDDDALNYLVSGIARVIDYYNSRNSGATIKIGYVTGSGGDCRDIEGFLSGSLGMDVKVLRELEGFKTDKNLKGESFGAYLTCIGAAIAPVGFVEQKADARKKMEVMPQEGNMQSLSLLVLAGGLLVAVVLAVVSNLQVTTAKKENKQLQDRVEELQPAKEVYHTYLQQKYTHTKLNYFYNSTVLPGEELVEFIEEMELKMPSSLNVQSFVANNEGVTMSLTVTDKKDAAKLIQQFRSFESVSNVAVSGISDTGAVMVGEPIDKEPIVSFSISITYKGADERAAEALAKQAAEAAAQQTTEAEE